MLGIWLFYLKWWVQQHRCLFFVVRPTIQRGFWKCSEVRHPHCHCFRHLGYHSVHKTWPFFHRITNITKGFKRKRFFLLPRPIFLGKLSSAVFRRVFLDVTYYRDWIYFVTSDFASFRSWAIINLVFTKTLLVSSLLSSFAKKPTWRKVGAPKQALLYFILWRRYI